MFIPATDHQSTRGRTPHTGPAEESLLAAPPSRAPTMRALPSTKAPSTSMQRLSSLSILCLTRKHAKLSVDTREIPCSDWLRERFVAIFVVSHTEAR